MQEWLQKLGDIKMLDGMVLDGLTDVYNKVHMGVCAEKCATDYNITREDQDNFAVESYKRSAKLGAKVNSTKKLYRFLFLREKEEPVIFCGR